MLEYTLDDAEVLLKKNCEQAEQNLAQIAWDLDYLRDQMTITEVKLFLQRTWVLTPHFFGSGHQIFFWILTSYFPGDYGSSLQLGCEAQEGPESRCCELKIFSETEFEMIFCRSSTQ